MFSIFLHYISTCKLKFRWEIIELDVIVVVVSANGTQ